MLQNNKPLKKETTPQKQNPDMPPILNKIKDEKLRETLILIKTSTKIPLNYTINLEEPREIEEHFKEELEGYLNEKYRDISEKISELREKGEDMMVWTFKLMAVPLKIKLFIATGDKKDFNIVTSRINEINRAITSTLDAIHKREEIYRQRKLAERKRLESAQLEKQKNTKPSKKKFLKKKVVKRVVTKKSK